MGGSDVEGVETEALNGGENVVGGFGPAEGLRIGVDGVEVGLDRDFQFRRRAVDAAADLLFGDGGEEALDLIDPGTGGRREVNKSRRIKSGKGDARALAEMLRTGWFSSVYVKSADTHRLKALLGARDQLVKLKRPLSNQEPRFGAMEWPTAGWQGSGAVPQEIPRERDVSQPAGEVWASSSLGTGSPRARRCPTASAMYVEFQ